MQNGIGKMTTKKRSHSPKSSANRDAYISGAFRQFLADSEVKFAALKSSDQLHLTSMISQTTTRFREHSHYLGCAFFGMHELESRFGRSKFKVINDTVNIFIVESEWSKTEGRTKPFRLTQRFADLRTEFFSRRNTEATDLLAENGDLRHVVPQNALMYRRKTESSVELTREGWKGKTVTSAVQVNQTELQRLADHIQYELDAHDKGKREPGAIDRKHANFVLNDTQIILHNANNNVAPGYVIHRYQESISGRLYAKEVNLQNTHRQVRLAALHGLWDYDIENCHYSILQQMAERAGFECKAITFYLQNKSQIRSQLAQTVGATELQIKKALLAMVYGASMSTKPDAAIPETLGAIDIAITFYDQIFIRNLAREIKSATKVILASTKRQRGSIANLQNLKMTVKGKKSRQLLAHLLQGVEAVALEAAHDVYPGEIVLLQHDGFTATSPNLSIEKIETAIFKATGYHLTMSRSGPLQANPMAALINLDQISANSQMCGSSKRFI
jgi:hypothetical protein